MANQDPGRLRARLKNGVVTVRVLLRHPMETGSRQDKTTGKMVPRHYIREVICEHNGKSVLTMNWSWGVSANPYLSFDLRDGKPGDMVAVRWLDDRGDTGVVEGKVK